MKTFKQLVARMVRKGMSLVAVCTLFATFDTFASISRGEGAADESAYFETGTTALSIGRDEAFTPDLPSVVIPPGRPDWIEQAAKHKPGDDWAVVDSGPFVDRAKCEEQLDIEIKRAADEYVNNLLHSDIAASLLRLQPQELRRELLRSTDDVYAENIQVSFGPMSQLHAKLQFTEEFRNRILAQWRQIRMAGRLGQVGVGVMVVLGLLSTAFGYYRLETSRRSSGVSLQFAAAAMILIIVSAGIFVARWVPWI